jgi:hypothetical protein
MRTTARIASFTVLPRETNRGRHREQSLLNLLSNLLSAAQAACGESPRQGRRSQSDPHPSIAANRVREWRRRRDVRRRHRPES